MSIETTDLETLLKELAVRMYFNGRTDVVASSDVGVAPDLKHAEPIMETHVKDTAHQINDLCQAKIRDSLNGLLEKLDVLKKDGAETWGAIDEYRAHNQALTEVKQAIQSAIKELGNG